MSEENNKKAEEIAANAKAKAEKTDAGKQANEKTSEEVKAQTNESGADLPNDAEVAPKATDEVKEEEAPKAQEKTTPTEVDVKTEEAPVEVAVADEEFDWEEFEYGLKSKSKKEREELTKLYEETITTIDEHTVTEGKVINMTDREAIVDIGYKSEGVISLNEFRYNPDLKVGDEVEVLVDKQEDKDGQLVLSHRKARAIKAWDRVNLAFENEEVVNGYVKCRTKGGMIVDVFGIEAFLPGSQIDVKPIRDYDAYVDKTMEFKVVKINHEFKNVVVSHKALIEEDLEEQKKEIIGKLEKGQVLEGVVKNITSYGVFIDLGGVDGLVHITDLSWSRINHPSEVVELDQKLNVVILDFDEDKTRIQLGLKQLEAHPWDNLDKDLAIGDKVKGKVVVLADYGAFVEIIPGVEGLIHVSEMSWSTHLRSAQDFMSVGDEVEATVLTLDREDRKMSLGIKQLTPDPWTDITTKYPIGSKHKGTVRNFTNFGVFVELEEGIDGLIHISDLSWTKKVKHPSEFTSIGAVLDVVVLDVDVENRRLSLGHKQVEDNPFDTYATLLEEGSVLEGKVSEIVDKGAEVRFENLGIEAFVPSRHMAKEDGTIIEKGEVTDFKIIEFNKDSRRVVASKTELHKAVKAEKEQVEKKQTKQAVKKIQTNVERSTLGDLDALSALKEQMEKDEEGK
ncbi:30S ribosomal protein S1 [Owenweeksia hongkongensis]|uniref:Small ribosomal subunit protein bS1 n=1 Tax=Owenweeksia hongkongensis (strain DSM 17368 / CIP 108786 / JCM 12287 / NRRL B-23963 / UST20020801) TaxID=926562 RepID=G8R2N4_OWEHD|nr:30S ribosomal protein S1 [Owenweeksia hongkongensis]AEV34046.1 ribosomal protein S1 [Owenweeksia hongkongensis DSM 17368]